LKKIQCLFVCSIHLEALIEGNASSSESDIASDSDFSDDDYYDHDKINDYSVLTNGSKDCVGFIRFYFIDSSGIILKTLFNILVLFGSEKVSTFGKAFEAIWQQNKVNLAQVLITVTYQVIID